MNQTSATIAVLALGAAVATAGIAPAPSGKEAPAPSPPTDPCAGPISYSNVELLYAHTTVDRSGFDEGEGGGLRLEYSPVSNLYLTAGAEYVSTGYSFHGFTVPGSVDHWVLNAGIGGHIVLSPNIHLAGDAGFLRDDSDYQIGATIARRRDDTGWYVRPHLRAKWGCLTVHAGAEYRDIEDTNWSFFARLYYQVAANWDLTAGFHNADESDVITAGVRWHY